MKYLTQFLFFIALSSCLQSESIEESGNTFSKTDKKYTIEFYDTLNLAEPDYIEHTDFDGNYFVSIESPDKSILIHNKKGTLVSKISRYGDGPEEYKKVQAVGLNSFNNSVIVVTKKGKVLEYDFKGELLRSNRINTQNIYISSDSYKRLNVVNKDEILLHTAADINIRTKAYFENTHTLSLYNIVTGDIKNFAPYSKESIYRKKMFPSMLFPVFSFNYGAKKEVLVIYPYEKKVYRYQTNSAAINYNFNTFPEYFSTIKSSNKFDSRTQIRLLQENSFYLSVSTDGEFILLFYLTGENKDEITLSNTEMNKNAPRRARYLELYDYSGRKKCKDIELPKGVAPFRMFSKDNILFMRTFAPANNNEDEGNVFYWGRLVEQ